MESKDYFYLKTTSPLKVQNAGLFISRGEAMHPTRVIHSHELIFVKQGELDMWEEDQIFHLCSGETLHLWPGRQHGSTKAMPLGLKFYWVHFELEDRNGRDERRAGDEFIAAIKVPQVVQMNQPERLERLFLMFLDDQESGMLHPYAANLLMSLMLTEVAQSVEHKPQNQDDLNAVATWAHTYIRMNYDRPITTSIIADALGYNADYLGRIYRQIYGVTLTEAINRRRIKFACEYLLDSNLTIEQIALKCGFADPDYFRRIFRRYTQVSPGKYREEYSRVHVNTH